MHPDQLFLVTSLKRTKFQGASVTKCLSCSHNGNISKSLSAVYKHDMISQSHSEGLITSMDVKTVGTSKGMIIVQMSQRTSFERYLWMPGSL